MQPYARPGDTTRSPMALGATPEPGPVIFIVEGDRAERARLSACAQEAGWTTQIFATGLAFLEAATPDGPGCILLGAGMRDMDGLQFQIRLGAEGRETPIIMLTTHADVPLTVRAMKAGANAVLAAPVTRAALLDAIDDAVARSRRELSGRTLLRELRDRYASLRPREREVMARVVKGLLNKQIAFELGLREITVKVHRGRMMAKMQARSVIDLVRMSDRLHITGEAD